ncbi:transmembrane protein 79-like [Astyanax mexicanus]|uniref:Transmembrane protein 79-like n=1 Tax=Astyanax mexicanus TaxID=7994 RepID=A0A8T2M0A1_ASTMX|nr:transmembrane protein 79-like [Astyanax mexicanus]
MSETLPADSEATVKGPLGVTAGADTPGWSPEEEKMKTDVSGMEGEDRIVTSAHMEPSTLQYPGDKANQPGGTENEKGSDLKLDSSETDVAAEEASVRSDCASVRGGPSRTESEREFGVREKQEEGEEWMEKDAPEKERETHLEIEVEELNAMPEKAAGVFGPSVTVNHSIISEPLKQNGNDWEENTERTAFLRPHGTPPDGYYNKNMDYDYDYSKNNKQCCGCTGTNRDALKMGVSIFMSALIFPVLVWGGHTFLPFDAPLLDSAPLRLVYMLRCSVFAVIPIVLGMLVLGVSRLRYCSLKPRCDGEPEVEQVNIHRRYVDDSISLFLLYFLQLGVMAAYLNQNLLKLVPLLTIIFAFGRLVYWIAAAWGSSVRAFGFGFSFWPMLTMLVANLYFIFMADSAGSIFAPDEIDPPETSPEHRQRFWG